MWDGVHETVQEILQDIILIGGVIMSLWYGLTRIYKTARSVEKILEFSTEEKANREKLAAKVEATIETENARHDKRDVQLAQVAADLAEITREIRPNGGSSMKDVLNQTNERVYDMSTRISVLETKMGMK